MNRELFVQNIKEKCAVKGVKPTVACRESGVGSSFVNDIERGQTPSVAKVQLLAQYLGCTVSELLGEQPGEEQSLATDEAEWLTLYRSTAPEHRPVLLASVKALLNARPL